MKHIMISVVLYRLMFALKYVWKYLSGKSYKYKKKDAIHHIKLKLLSVETFLYKYYQKIYEKKKHSQKKRTFFWLNSTEFKCVFERHIIVYMLKKTYLHFFVQHPWTSKQTSSTSNRKGNFFCGQADLLKIMKCQHIQNDVNKKRQSNLN